MKNDLMVLAWVASLGALGALSRYLVGVWLKSTGQVFPTWTLLVNVIGCFAMGYLAAAFAQRPVNNPAVYPGFTAGFLGALTTFSAFSVETLELYQSRHWTWALANVAANLLLGLVAAWFGLHLGRS